jgi:hypothetical protein
MSLRIIAFALAALLAADAVTIKNAKSTGPAKPEDLHVKSAESSKPEDLHVKTLEGESGKKNMKKKILKKAKAETKKTRVIETDAGKLELQADEVLSPRLTKHLAEENHPVVQTLRSDEGMAYYGEIRVGGQVQQGIYDTGSFDLVVLSACTKLQHPINKKTMEPICCAKDKCPKANYNNVLSGNFVKDTAAGLEKITYGSGPVTVQQGYDHVEFRSTDGKDNISDDDVPTKVIVDHHIDLFKETDLQAIVGLGPGKFEEREKRMINHMGMKRFMVCFNEDPNKDGVITWNDKDRSFDPAFKSVPVLGKLFWATKISTFELKGSVKSSFQACEPSCGAIIDTGTSLLTPPKEVIDQLSELLDKGHITDCSDMKKFPTLHFTLGDHEFTLPPEAYIGAVDDEEVGFKHENLAFPLLPMKAGASSILKDKNHTLALKQENQGPVNMKQEGTFPVHGACAIMMSEGDPSDNTPWGPMVIFGMQLFRKYAVQFDVVGDIEGVKPSLSNPTRIMHFTEASPDCQQDSQGKTFQFKQRNSAKRALEGSKLRKLNLKKIRKSTFQRHLDASRTNHLYKVNGANFRYKNMVRI